MDWLVMWRCCTVSQVISLFCHPSFGSWLFYLSFHFGN